MVKAIAINTISFLAAAVLSHLLGYRRSECSVWIERSVGIKTTDGITLVADVYHPKVQQKTATVMIRIPLTKMLVNTLLATVLGRMWAARGYTVVIQGTRGRYESGGGYSPFHHERQDGLETLQWLAQQPWYNTKVGMWGGSYFGYTQWVLAESHPKLSALFLQICSANFYGMFYPGGAFSLESALFWAIASHGQRDAFPTHAILQPGYDGFPLIEADTRIGPEISFFKDWVSHSEPDHYWQAIDGQDRPRDLQAPALLLAGWYDAFLPTQLQDFDRIQQTAKPEVAAATRLIIGPWVHARTVTFPDGTTPRNYRLESLAPSIPWFDQHLRENRPPKSTIPNPPCHSPVRIYVMGIQVWRDEQEFPLARTRYTDYYLSSGGHANSLNGDGMLKLTAPTTTESFDTYVYDPRNPVPSAGGTMLGSRAGIAQQNQIELRSDVLIYTTPPLRADLEVTGLLRLVLYVSTTAACTDFTSKLVDVYPDGRAYNVADGILRRRYLPQLDANAIPTLIEIDLWATSIVFFQGHRIRLEVSSSNYPRYDRNPNTGNVIATETHPIPATQTIYHSPQTPSRLILPIIPA